jgi:cleavage and polyadenylation specificity factor subunit 3
MVRIQRLGMFLEAHFGEVEYHMPDEDMETEQEEPTSQDEPSFLIQLDDAEARINLLSMARSLLSVSYFMRLTALCADGRQQQRSFAETCRGGSRDGSFHRKLAKRVVCVWRPRGVLGRSDSETQSQGGHCLIR